MLLPALNKARALARKSACMNNCKSIGTAMNMYVGDHNGYYPLTAWEPELITQQTIISFGPLVFLPFPFEMFSMFSLRLRKYSNYEYPLLCSIANGYYGYLPDRAAFAMGGYEVEWLCFARDYVVAQNAGDIAVTQTLDAIEK